MVSCLFHKDSETTINAVIVNLIPFLAYIFMLVDKTGACAIVGWQSGKVKIIRGQEGFQVMGFGHNTAFERLRKLEKLSNDPA